MKSEVPGFLGPLYDEAAAIGFFESAAFAFEVADQGSLVLAQGGALLGGGAGGGPVAAADGGALLKSELLYPGSQGGGLGGGSFGWASHG